MMEWQMSDSLTVAPAYRQFLKAGLHDSWDDHIEIFVELTGSYLYSDFPDRDRTYESKFGLIYQPPSFSG